MKRRKLIIFLYICCVGLKQITSCDLLMYIVNFHIYKNVKQDIINLGIVKSVFNDPDIGEQWFLVRSKNSSNILSHELDGLWERGITGKGVVIGIIDGGVEQQHRDLQRNYNKTLSFNFLTNSTETYASNYGRTTEIAGIISAVENNKKCGVGVAPSSQFSDLQIYDDETKGLDDRLVKRAFSYWSQYIDIYLFIYNNYGNSEIISSLSSDTMNVLRFHSKYGRRKLGSIYITGSGQYRSLGSNCAFGPYQNRPEVLVFGTIASDRSVPSYAEGCTAVLAASLGTDSLSNKHKIYSTTWGNLCEKSVSGMFSSTSISAGIIALLIGENPELTVRQIITLIILTSIQYDKNAIRNAAGFYYSYFVGFGVLNAKELIRSSRNHTIRYLSNRNKCKTFIFRFMKPIRENNYINFYIYTSGCYDSEFCVTEIEQTFVVLTLASLRRNSITIYLTSPGGTRLKIIEPRPSDHSSIGFRRWRLKILGYFGEPPVGVWILGIQATYRAGFLVNIELLFDGTCKNPTFNVMRDFKIRNFLRRNNENLRLFIHDKFYCNIGSFNRNCSLDIYSFSQENYRSIRNYEDW